MKKQTALLASCLAFSFPALFAQEPPAPGGSPASDAPRGPSPIIAALDLNGDGTIDAAELAKATESLKKLDKNGDGKITEDEFRPQRGGSRPGAPGRADPGTPSAQPGRAGPRTPPAQAPVK